MANKEKFFIYLFAGALMFSYCMGPDKVQANELIPGIISIPQIIKPCAEGGNQDGVHRQYYDDGKLFMETHCSQGKKQGLSFQYDLDGNLLKEESYVNGQLEGSVKEYYPNGFVRGEARYKNGKLDGLQRRYWDNGNLASKQEYINGSASTPVEGYDNNGNPAQEDRFDANSQVSEHFVASGAVNARQTSPGEAVRNDRESSAEVYQPYLSK